MNRKPTTITIFARAANLALLILLTLGSAGVASAQTRPRRVTTTEPTGKQTTGGAPVIVSQADEQAVAEHARAFSTLSDPEFKAWLQGIQYTAVPAPEVQQRWVAAFITYKKIPALENGDALYRLSERTRPVMEFFNRAGKLRFVVFPSPTPFMQSISGACIGISTGMLALMESDDELNAFVAHELAHEHSDRAYGEAIRARDFRRTQNLELECDAIAARVLAALGRDPRALGRIIFKTISWSEETARDNNGSNDYPSLATRLRLNEEICQQLAARPTAPNFLTLVERYELDQQSDKRK